MVTLILQRYLLKELGRAFLPAFACFELFLFLGFSVQLVHKGLDIINLRPLIPYMLLYACPYALPAALLTATVVVYGRLCADNELSAIRTCGVHLRIIIIPIIFVGIIFSVLTLYLNAKVLPRAFYRVQILQERAVKQILAGRASTSGRQRKMTLEPYHIYIGAIEGTTYKRLVVIEYADDYVTNVLIAKEGTININEPENIVMLTLRNGEFFKPNYRKPGDIPKTGNFEETTFEIPLQIKISETTRKFLTLPQLFALRKKVTQELGDPGELFKYPRQVKETTLKEILTLDSELKQSLEEQEIIVSRIKDASENVTKQTAKVEALKEDIKLSEQQIIRAKNSVEQIMQELKTKGEEQHLDSIRLFSEEDVEEVGGTEEVAKINKRISKEQQKIQDAQQYISALEKSQEQEKATIEGATSSLDVLNERENELKEKRIPLVARLEKAKKQELQHETSITIHKRLSPSLSCLVFVLLGIPLGIMTRCGNILISIGISFLLALILYYPLVMAGWVLADDLILPVIPALWGANFIVGAIGIIFFQRVFRK
ncbi:MAG TPA: LptF/LptG family permease [Candidatus Brocadiia bacterium]|nr:LptF/LptG family permease [Candidatus Brocadiales bacterium]